MFGKFFAKVFIFIIAFVFLLGGAFAARAGFVWFTLWYSAGPNGAVFGPSPQLVAPGGDGSQVTAIPLLGYEFSGWSDGRTDNPRTDRNVFANVNVTANFRALRYRLTYSAETGGTISGDNPQRVSWGGDGTPVTAVADPGYEFVDWSDGVLTATRQELGVFASVTVSARFRRLGHATLYIPGAKGSGKVDMSIPMNETKYIGQVNSDGMNVLAYIGSQGDFDVLSPANVWQRHYLKITNVDMAKQQVTVEFASIPQSFAFVLDQEMTIDLDQNNLADIYVKFEDLNVNRVELTLKRAELALNVPLGQTLGTASNSGVELINEEKEDACSFNFSRNLSLGMEGDDVKNLQVCLNKKGFNIAMVGVGSIGNETTYFGSLTEKALIRYQLAKNISPAAGYFGPITRAEILK